VKNLVSAAFMAAMLSLFAVQASAETNTLERVLESGTLRVCSPGDYRPFSFTEDGEHFEGLDVDLVASLASSLDDADVEFVKTTWSDLMTDFTSGKCDIGVGGISVTLERQQQAFFSVPYMINGKTPLVRCEDVDKYQTIEDINQPDVRVIFNPGGSNETFAKTKLADADLILYKDNVGIFNELVENRADVFVNEAAEGRVQSKRHPELCAVNPDDPLKYAEMAYLLPQGDVVFKHYVDQWFHLQKASGAYAELEQQWLPAD